MGRRVPTLRKYLYILYPNPQNKTLYIWSVADPEMHPQMLLRPAPCLHLHAIKVLLSRVYHYPPQSVKSTPRTTIKPLNIVAIKLHGKKHVMIDEVYYLQPIFEYVYHASPRGSPLLLLLFFFNLALVQWWIFIWQL